MRRTIDMELRYQPIIDGPPPYINLRETVPESDRMTMDTWKDIWVKQYKESKEYFGDLGEKTVGKLYGKNLYKPAICVASGPSLKHSLAALQENQTLPEPLVVCSALHNFGYFADNGLKADYWMTLDSGDIIFSDITDGCQHDSEWYWEKTEGQVLVSTICTPKELFEKWRGEIYLFATLLPDRQLLNKMHEIERFDHYISAHGHVGGGLQYFAKAVMGSSTVIFVGYDYCFDYDLKFHSYPTQYDNKNGNGIGHVIYHPDVFGNLRATWPSYFQFKKNMDFIVSRVPGLWVNCSEGIMGSYREGNIRQFQYMSLLDALAPYQLVTRVFLTTNKNEDGSEVSREPLLIKDYYENVQNGHEVVIY